MARDNQSGDLELGTDKEMREMEAAGRKGLFGRLNTVIQQNRGDDRPAPSAAEAAPVAAAAAAAPAATADDLALRRPRVAATGKMFIPEGAIIQGNVTASSETEIAGKVEGDVTIDGVLTLGKSALVTGNVRAGSCRVDGLVEGKVECSEEMDLGQSGRVNGDVGAGKRINLSGQVYGNVITPGVLRMAQTCRVQGDVRARSLTMEEGATLDGSCIMRAPSQK
jgi:cytoskeletal protein CcmA (bactofilin family)